MGGFSEAGVLEAGSAGPAEVQRCGLGSAWPVGAGWFGWLAVVALLLSQWLKDCPLARDSQSRNREAHYGPLL